jgi:hypothetical protein
MIRPFDFPDSFLMNRLAPQAILFNSCLASTRPVRPMRRALLGIILPSIQPETYVSTIEGAIDGFAQCSHRMGEPLAQLLTLSPEQSLAGNAATGLIEAILASVGSRQAHYLLAEAETQSDVYGFLRRSGFAVYARQTIWRGSDSPRLPDTRPSGLLRPTKPSDQLAINALFSSVVPAMVQQVERQPEIKKGWSLIDNGELVGFFECSAGPFGVWVNPYFHPSARHVSLWLTHLVHELMKTHRIPVFFCIRSYQEWVGSMLQSIGFCYCGEPSVLARRIVAPTLSPQPLQLSVVEGSAPSVTTLSPPASSL